MNCQFNGEGYGLHKNVERHWISQILRNLLERSFTHLQSVGRVNSVWGRYRREKAGMGRGGRVFFENVPPLIFLLIDY